MKKFLLIFFAMVSLATAATNKEVIRAVKLYKSGKPSKALKILNKYAKKGDKVALYFVGIGLYNGKGVVMNKELAVEYLTGAAKKGHIPALTMMGKICLEKGSDFYDVNKSLWWYKQASDLGGLEASSTLGFFYFMGDNVTRNYKTFLKYNNRAVKKDFAPALFLQGLAYERGLGVTINIPKACSLYSQASKYGYAPAGYVLGVIHYEKNTPYFNKRLASRHFYNSARAGFAPSQYMLAKLVQEGDFQNPDEIKAETQSYDDAFKWSERSSQQSFIPGVYQLANMYLKGHGCKKNKENAARLLYQVISTNNVSVPHDYKYLGSGSYSQNGELVRSKIKIDEDIDDNKTLIEDLQVLHGKFSYEYKFNGYSLDIVAILPRLEMEIIHSFLNAHRLYFKKDLHKHSLKY